MDKTTKPKNGFITNIGKSVSTFASKTQESIVHAVDKNGDGKFDRNDIGLSNENLQSAKSRVGEIAVSAGQSIKNSTDRIGKAIADSRLDKEWKLLRPVFADEYPSADDLPNMIRIVARDKKHSDSPICNGSIGYKEAIKGIDTLCIYEDYAITFGINFHPELSQGIFYAEPHHEHLFICLDEYFNYLKKARVNELEMIAQTLGAKRVQIAFKEQAKSASTRSMQANAKAGKLGASASYSADGNDYIGVEIAADLVFSGHDHPEVPELVYFRHESDIEKLIQMRVCNEDNKIQSKTYRFLCSKSSGIKESEAAKIDTVAGYLKVGASESFSSEVSRENRTELEYKIEF